MLNRLKEWKIVKQITKAPWYARFRRRFPSQVARYYEEDMERLASAEVITIDWPEELTKPSVGVIKDHEPYPRWPKYVRFCENNGFPCEIYDLNTHDWLERARKFDIIVGIIASEPHILQEMRRKFFVLETFLGIHCFPSVKHLTIYEDKTIEAFLSDAHQLPFIRTHTSNDRQDALRMVDTFRYPVVHKMDPGSGSIGVELVETKEKARKIVEQAFSPAGRATHSLYYRQKNSVYFQDFMPNDGYDIRVMVTGNRAFGYYRKVLAGDFRASGMNMVEKRELPEEAVLTAWKVNQVVQSPLLVVDMVHGLDGKYWVIEFSPICQMETPEQLHVNEVPGVYIIDPGAENMHFEPGKMWVHELSMREFLLNEYLPKVMIA